MVFGLVWLSSWISTSGKFTFCEHFFPSRSDIANYIKIFDEFMCFRLILNVRENLLSEIRKDSQLIWHKCLSKSDFKLSSSLLMLLRTCAKGKTGSLHNPDILLLEITTRYRLPNMRSLIGRNTVN